MRKSIIIVIVFLLPYFVFSNDTFFSLSGGNLIPVNEESVSIEMKEEVITLNFNEDFYEVTVDFTFYNEENQKELLVGFPFFCPGNYCVNSEIFDFKCWTNGVETSFEDFPIKRTIKSSDSNKLENAYVRSILFPKETVTKTKITYKATYPVYNNGITMSHAHWDGYYLFGTGSSWKNEIGKITLIIVNNLQYGYLSQLKMGKNIWGKSIKEKLIQKDEKTYELVMENIEPDYTDIFYIYFENILNDTGPKCFPAYFTFDKTITNTHELSWYKKNQLRIIRNAIYALHGYSFKSEDLRLFFKTNGENWYPAYQERVKNGFSENSLSDVEKKNIELILEEENKR